MASIHTLNDCQAFCAFSAEFKCERDALANVVEDLKRSDVIGFQWRGLSMCRNSFTGAQLVGWLQKDRGMGKE